MSKEKETKTDGFDGTTFVIKKAKGSVSIPSLDSEGNPIQKKFQGNLVFTPDGRPVHIMRTIEFLPIVIDVERGTYCQYKAQNEQEEIYLLEKRVDPNSGVITKKDYEKELNPEATKVKDELAKVKAASREAVDKLNAQNAAKEDALKKQAAEIEELKKKLSVAEKGK